MRMSWKAMTVVIWAALWAGAQAGSVADTLRVPGLEEDVEIIIDSWGVCHIYAKTERDLFFTQGFNAARDRLFQLEIWRRRATGTVAEICGGRELKRDIGSRLFRYRGDLDEEFNHYHPRGKPIIEAFVEGINAFIDLSLENPDLLPVEFGILGIRPCHWTPAVVVSRHQGLLMNLTYEIAFGRAVHALGAEKVKELSRFHPGEPDITLDDKVDGALLTGDVIGLYNAFKSTLRFQPATTVSGYGAGDGIAPARPLDEGSNNWLVGGGLTVSGYPIMANDPHRTLAIPSLRYWVHLNGPEWNVIGGGEPAIPGVSIGHNAYGAWGLTVFITDSEDLYVYDTHPEDPDRYRYGGGWERMDIILERFAVKGAPDTTVQLKFTRHGPVVFEDAGHHKAYAVRAAWLEPGGSPYLASLRMDQSKSWEEFRDACSYSHIPGENMIWADREGNIGWQVVGIAPIRPNWSGLVPVPGDGSYEWAGTRPIRERPHLLNPAEGYWVTANDFVVPKHHPYLSTVGWTWSDPFRGNRIREVLASGRKHSMLDMMRLQTDVLSIPARSLVPLLAELESGDSRVERARRRLLDWDFRMTKGSVSAGIYAAWEHRIRRNIEAMVLPPGSRVVPPFMQLTGVMDWLVSPSSIFGNDPIAGRDAYLLRCLEDAVDDLEQKLGMNMKGWVYGQASYKHVQLRHALSSLVDETLRHKLNTGLMPRGGYAYTVDNTGLTDNQSHGGTFRIIVDTSDWDRAVGMNSPGQSGDPDSPYYKNLFESWARGEYFPVFFSRKKVETVRDRTIILEPAGRWK